MAARGQQLLSRSCGDRLFRIAGGSHWGFDWSLFARVASQPSFGIWASRATRLREI